jgi:hypothetical protein
MELKNNEARSILFFPWRLGNRPSRVPLVISDWLSLNLTVGGAWQEAGRHLACLFPGYPRSWHGRSRFEKEHPPVCECWEVVLSFPRPRTRFQGAVKPELACASIQTDLLSTTFRGGLDGDVSYSARLRNISIQCMQFQYMRDGEKYDCNAVLHAVWHSIGLPNSRTTHHLFRRPITLEHRVRHYAVIFRPFRCRTSGCELRSCRTALMSGVSLS